MLRMVFLGVLMLMGVQTVPAPAAKQAPAGYVVDLNLAGSDEAARTVVVRRGAELEGKLMMPLFDGDVVFVREDRSSVELELGGGEQVKVGGSVRRYAVKGEIATGDGGWDLLGAIATVFAGEDEQAPENMVSKGGALRVPMAVTGRPNWITARPSLWLAWQGGTGPYTVSMSGEGVDRVLAEGIGGTSGTFPLGGTAGTVPQRFALVIRDSTQQAVRIRFRVADGVPNEIRRRSGGAVTQALVEAAALTAIEDGAWSIEAAQAAGETTAGRQFRQRIADGWRLVNSE